MVNLSCLPPVYVDEDFRSVIKRYHLRSGNQSETESRRELLGTDARSILPRNIHFLFNQLPKSFDKENILYKHTAFPLLYPFVNDEMKSLLLDDIEYIKGSTHSASAYLNKFISKKLRYCPECVESDISIYGESYARRIHQLIGFDFCLYHDKSLIYEFSDDNKSVGIEIINTLKPILIEILNILNYNWQETHSYQIKFKYIAAFYENGYLLKNGKPRTNIFIDELLRRYGSILSKFGIDSHYLSIHNRIWKMINLQHKNPNPILHVFMQCFLKGTTETFLTQQPISIVTNIPFGNGPWFCHNHLCVSYYERTIKTCKRKFRKSSLPTAEFQCPNCGYTYVKNTENNEGEYKTVSFGKLWENELVYKYKNTYSLRETATYCRVGEAVARRYLLKLSPEYKMKKAKKFFSTERVEEIINVYKETKSIRRTSRILKVNRNTLKSYIPKDLLNNTTYFFEDNQEKINSYKEKIINTINTLENPLRMDIRNAVGQEIYKFLMKEEKDWMEEVLPSKKTNLRNWAIIDNKISNEIIDTVSKLNEDVPNYRLTKNRIKNNISQYSKSLLANNPDKLFNSMKTLEESVENKEEYQIRKIDYAIYLLKKNNRNITYENMKSMPAYHETSAKVDKLIKFKIKQNNTFM
ncbi:TnsD family transposase [Bacillus tianshenii]|uniref:TnsD family transposase n=1 Tax=Sutcliffiella tianshenii TaxID=1463404 RepID=UPI001CD3F17D|nr:TnsD family transposase [Bacillus tianshenii]MCA1321978.1 TnsD family transposase [Bacillus tianshenii]